jgi:hypothetical protein
LQQHDHIALQCVPQLLLLNEEVTRSQNHYNVKNNDKQQCGRAGKTANQRFGDAPASLNNCLRRGS